MSLADLDELKRIGTISDFTQVTNSQIIKRQGPEASGITYSRISRSQVFFSPEVEDFYEHRRGKPITTLSGTNNCGKTYLLKQLFSLVGPGGYLMSCNRFSHVDVLNTVITSYSIHYTKLYENR